MTNTSHNRHTVLNENLKKKKILKKTAQQSGNATKKGILYMHAHKCVAVEYVYFLSVNSFDFDSSTGVFFYGK